MNADNAQFLYEKLVFNKDFAGYIASFLSSTEVLYNFLKTAEERAQLRTALSPVADKLIINLLLHGSGWDDASLQHIAIALDKIVYSEDPRESAKLLENFINVPTRLPLMLVKCNELAVRRFIHAVCLHACTKVTKSGGFEKPESIARRFVDLMLSQINNELSPHWMRFKQFFELLRDLHAKNREILGQHFLQKDVVALLLDFYMGKLSPLYTVGEKRGEMGSMSIYPDFIPLIDLVSGLVSDTVVEGKKGKLSEKALKCLYCTDLIHKYLREGGNVGKLKGMVVALMRENRKYTKQICKMLLNVIGDYELHKLQQYLPLISEVIALPDSLQMLRIEWVLGIPQPICKSSFKPVYGLAAVFEISEDVITYVSPLGNITRDDPLLWQLWKNRKRVEFVTANCVRTMLQQAETCEPLFRYLKALPAPTYQFSHYLGWVNGFLDTYERSISKFSDILTRKEREGLILETRGLMQKFLQRLDAADFKGSFMIGKWKEEKEFFSCKFGEHNVRLTAFEVVTEVYPSRPDGKTNLSLSNEYMVQYFPHLSSSRRHFGHYDYSKHTQKASKPAAEAKQKNAGNEWRIIEEPVTKVLEEAEDISAWAQNVERNVDLLQEPISVPMRDELPEWKQEIELKKANKTAGESRANRDLNMTHEGVKKQDGVLSKRKKMESDDAGKELPPDSPMGSQEEEKNANLPVPMQTETGTSSAADLSDKKPVTPAFAPAILRFELINCIVSLSPAYT